MKPNALIVALVVCGVAGCSGVGFISPNDPQYARTGAPRKGEPAITADKAYGPIYGPDGDGQGGRM